MSGENNLSTLLQSMQPTLQPGEYVFCSVEPTYDYAKLQPIGLFYETEGLTLILARSVADAAQLPYSATFHWITLSVHSSLEAVGFLAAVARKLAEQGISVNPVSAFYHDHLFVPVSRSAEAMQQLQTLSGEAQDGAGQ